jgi:hypothetical protein
MKQLNSAGTGVLITNLASGNARFTKRDHYGAHAYLGQRGPPGVDACASGNAIFSWGWILTTGVQYHYPAVFFSSLGAASAYLATLQAQWIGADKSLWQGEAYNGFIRSQTFDKVQTGADWTAWKLAH